MFTRQHQEIFRFILVGGTCFFLSMLTLYVGTDLLGLHYLVSFVLAIIIANLAGWAMNRNITFKTKSSRALPELARYFSANLSSMLISMLLTFFLVSILGMHYLVASATIAALMTVLNYIVHKNWSFKNPAPQPSPRRAKP